MLAKNGPVSQLAPEQVPEMTSGLRRVVELASIVPNACPLESNEAADCVKSAPRDDNLSARGLCAALALPLEIR